jgi:vacuolar-type H+-ATPase subunit I/STV1
MVVMIQALRLLYYEFSTKFFKGTGKPYTPYKISINLNNAIKH